MLSNCNDDLTSEKFDNLFREYYKSLRAYAFRYVNDLFIAEDIVQDVFYKLWEKRDKLDQISSIRSYLFTSVFNSSNNYNKHRKIEDLYQARQANSFHEIEVYYQQYINNSSDSLIACELERQIHEIIDNLPDQCKNVIILSRFHGMKNQEIADKLGVTIKAIEKQITKALRVIRSKLKDYIIIFLF